MFLFKRDHNTLDGVFIEIDGNRTEETVRSKRVGSRSVFLTVLLSFASCPEPAVFQVEINSQ